VKILVIRGTGYLEGLNLPTLAQHHEVRVLDLHAPALGPREYLQADVTEPVIDSGSVDVDSDDCALYATLQ